MHGWRRYLPHITRRLLYHECRLRHIRCDYFLGLHTAGGDEIAVLAAESLEIGWGQCQLNDVSDGV